MELSLPVTELVAFQPEEVQARAATPPPYERHRFRVLDGIRGIAIIAVLFTHASFVIPNRIVSRSVQFGWTGVDLFFVLSGFLITGILIDTRGAVNRASSFYARRVLRIFPIYYLTLGVVLAAQMYWPWIANTAEMHTWQSRLPYFLYFVNLVPLWHHGLAHQTLLQHFWSLAVEEQFYFVWPLVVWHISTRQVYRLCAVALGAGLLLRVIAGAHFGYDAWIFMFPLTRADGLFAGSALAALLASGYRPSPRLLAAIAGTCLFGLGTVAAFGHLQLFYGGPLMCTFGFTCLALLFTVLIAYTIERNEAGLSRALTAGWLCNCGRYSYGMYVFHLPLYYLFEHLAVVHLHRKFPLTPFASVVYLATILSATYVTAWVSFHCFEQVFLRWKHRFAPEFSTRELPANVVYSS